MPGSAGTIGGGVVTVAAFAEALVVAVDLPGTPGSQNYGRVMRVSMLKKMVYARLDHCPDSDSLRAHYAFELVQRTFQFVVYDLMMELVPGLQFLLGDLQPAGDRFR